jgi:hypothetical protein
MKFDTSTIEGFENMSAEDKVNALLGAEIPEPDLTGYVKKEVFDNKASEAANLSKQLRERMSEDEKKKADEQKVLADLQTEIETLRKNNETLVKERTIADYTAKFIAQGYEKALAEETAKAMAEGDMNKVFENGEKYRAAMEKKIKEDLMDKTPKPDGNGGGKEADAAVARAKEIAKSRNGGNKTYSDIMDKYKK